MSQKIQNKLVTEGIKLYNKKDFLSAINKFEQSLHYHGETEYLAFYYIGKILMQETSNYAQACHCMMKAVEYLEEKTDSTSKQMQGACYVALGYMYGHVGSVSEAADFYYKGYLNCDFLVDKVNAFSGYIMLLVCTAISPKYLLQSINEYNNIVQMYIQKKLPKKIRKAHHLKRKIHIAYISPDFRNHVAYKYYYHLLKNYDRDKFFVTCISLGKEKDICTEEIKHSVDEFFDASKMDYYKLAVRIKSMCLDILVDLAGHTANSGLPLLGYRLATVQISGIGWMETTGCEFVDYLITDKYLDEPQSSYIVEKPLYLTSAFCHSVTKEFPESSGAPCKKNGHITFGVFNRITKFTGEIVALWLRIMKAVPDAKILIACPALRQKAVVEFLKKRLAAVGFDMERIIFDDAIENYMERYLDVDIALDTYPYTGCGTTFDALYMGVPVVSLYGERRSSRFGLSILNNAGIGELATATGEEYVERAVALANDWELLDILHKNLRTMLKKSPAMDGEKYVREMEAQYEQILAEAKSKIN